MVYCTNILPNLESFTLMPRTIAIAAVLLTATASPAFAQNMNAEAFHKRATALQRKGPLAVFSRGEIKQLMSEVEASGLRAREQRLATLRAGGKPRYCPPEGGKSNMGAEEFMTRLSAIPAAERARINMAEATVRLLAGRYPCR